jgi:hypothetical protein
MLQGIFAMCWCMDQHMEVMDQRLQIVRCNQKIIHSQRDGPLLEFPDVPVFSPIHVPDPYASLTLAELATFSIGLAWVDDDDEEEEEVSDDEEMEDTE